MERIYFPPGEEPRVLTTDLCKVFGDCALCPGIAHAGELEVDGEDPDELVFCCRVFGSTQIRD